MTSAPRGADRGMPRTSSSRPSPSKSNGVAARARDGSSEPRRTSPSTPAVTTAATAAAMRRRGTPPPALTSTSVDGSPTAVGGESAVVEATCGGPPSAAGAGATGSGAVIVPARRQYGPSAPTASSSSASQASVADDGLAEGSLASSQLTHACTPGGVCGATSASGGGGELTCWYRTATGVVPSKGGRPASSSYAITPTA
jgi:hypothetical protein